jgi:hypothetical protein
VGIVPDRWCRLGSLSQQRKASELLHSEAFVLVGHNTILVSTLPKKLVNHVPYFIDMIEKSFRPFSRTRALVCYRNRVMDPSTVAHALSKLALMRRGLQILLRLVCRIQLPPDTIKFTLGVTNGCAEI